jgi:Protein of unknown function (DUF3043)
LFRRTKTDTPAPFEETAASTTQKKGRPTPTRKEAEAANKARAKVPRTRKEQAAARRTARAESSARVREAMRTGDERGMLARDKGPVKRFIRDYVDSRFTLVEILLPAMFVVVILGWTGSRTLSGYLNAAMFALLLLVVFEVIRLRMRVRKQLRARFPDEDLSGTTYYTVLRAMQMRFMRQPKPQVKLGQQLPERYR